MTRPTVALLPDFVEEGWPSMDLFAEMLREQLGRTTTLIEPRPQYRRLFAGRIKGGANLDRVRNRYRLYPRALRGVQADAFLIPDHSYAHLVHALPAERTAVVCHDINAFRSLLEPDKEPRLVGSSRIPRTLVRNCCGFNSFRRGAFESCRLQPRRSSPQLALFRRPCLGSMRWPARPGFCTSAVVCRASESTCC